MIRTLALVTLVCPLALAACSGADTGIRNGPQAVHPASTAPAAVAAQPAAAPASDDPLAIAQPYYREFCLDQPTFAARQAAILASDRFGPPREFKTSFSTYTSYPILALERASVTLVEGAATGLICSVGVQNKGPSLFDDGRTVISS